MFEIKIDGIKEVADTLNHLQKNVEELEEKKEISIGELLNEEFMNKYTKWNNFNDFIINSKLVPEGTTVLTKEIFEAIPDKEFNEYVTNNSSFESWIEMLQTALKDYIKRKSGL